MSGSRVVLAGDPLAAVVHGIGRIHDLQGAPSVVIGRLAVLCRLTTPYRATTDLDVVDRLLGPVPTLQLLRSAPDAAPVEPSAVQLPTPYGAVKVDVLEVQDIELDVVRLVNDPVCRPEVLAQLGAADDQLARDVAQHGDLWFDRERRRSLRWIRATGVGAAVVEDDLVFVAEMLGAATAR